MNSLGNWCNNVRKNEFFRYITFLTIHEKLKDLQDRKHLNNKVKYLSCKAFHKITKEMIKYSIDHIKFCG